jgi:hypothetical protein
MSKSTWQPVRLPMDDATFDLLYAARWHRTRCDHEHDGAVLHCPNCTRSVKAAT